MVAAMKRQSIVITDPKGELASDGMLKNIITFSLHPFIKISQIRIHIQIRFSVFPLQPLLVRFWYGENCQIDSLQVPQIML